MSESPSPVKVQTLDHVTLVVADLEKSRRFYCDVLGMEQVSRPGFTFDGRWFQAGSTQIHLILEHEQSGRTGDPDPLESKTSRHHHFAFQVDDARAAEEWLRTQGAQIVSPAKQRPDGAVQVFAADPDGYVVELCSIP